MPEFLRLYDRLRAPFDERQQFDNRRRAARLIRRRRPWRDLLDDDDPVREQRPAPLLELRTASAADAGIVTGMLEAHSGSDPVAVLARCESRGEAAQPYADATAFEAVRRTEADVEALVGELRRQRGRRIHGPHRRPVRPLEFPRTESLLDLFAVYGGTYQEQHQKEGEKYVGPHVDHRNPLVVAEALWKRAQKNREARKAAPEQKAERTGEDREAAAPGRSGPRWVGGLARKALDGGVGLAGAGYTGLYLGTSRLLRLLGAGRAGAGLTFDRFDQWVITPLGLLVNFLLGLSLLLGVQNIPDLEVFEQVLTVLVLLLLVLLRALAYLGLSRPWRPYRWLVRQPYLPEDADAPANHRAATQHVGETYRRLKAAHARGDRRALHDRARVLRLLLVNAVLEDLAAAYPERHRYRTGFHRPVLVADRSATRWKGDADSPAHDADLVRLIEQVRAEQYAPDPLVIVVVVPDPAPLADRETGSAGRELTAWADRRRHVAHLGPSRTVSVDIGPDAEERARRHGQVRGPERTEPTAAQRWRDAATVAGGVLAVLLLLVGTVVVLDRLNGRCWRPLLADPGVWGAQAENGRRDCVGYTDGSFVFHERLETVQERIEKQNSEVVSARTPYVTVVYFGQLSVSDIEAGNSRLAGVQGELMGLALSQRDHNKGAPDEGTPRIRLLIANAGPSWEHGEAVAERIGRRVREENIVAAVGFGQSLTTTSETIEVLSGYALPMVSSTATFDDIAHLKDGSYSDFFFPVAPSNTRLAHQTAEWALRGAASGEWELPAAGTALAVADTTGTESYGEHLAGRFMDHFTAGGGRAKTESLGALTYGANGVIPYQRSGGQSLSTVIERICADPPDLVYYAGRSANFGVFLDGLYDENRCADGITVLGGDDIAQYVTDNADRLSSIHDRISVYYTPLAADGTWGSPSAQSTEVPAFYADLAELAEDLEADSPSIAHAVMAHDALEVVSRALDGVAAPLTGAGRSGEPAALLFPEIQQTGRQVGISGALAFGEVDTGYWYGGRLVQLVRVDDAGKPRVVAACGWITHQRQGAGPHCLPLPGTE